MRKKKEAPVEAEVKEGFLTIIPLKDHKIFRNQDKIIIEKGGEMDVPTLYKQTLITEGVIKKTKEG